MVRVGHLIALGLVGVLSIVGGCGRRDPDQKSESQPLDWVDREDEPFPGLVVPRPIARSLLRAARKRDPNVCTSEEVGRVLLNALLADRSPSTFPVVSDHVTAGLNVTFWDYGGSDKQLSFQAKPGDSHRELLIVSVADPNRIQGLEDQQVWLREAKEGLAVVFKPETRPEVPRIRVVEYTKRTLPKHSLEGHIYFRGVGVQVNPRDLLDATGVERFMELLVSVAAALQREHDELFGATVDVITQLGVR